MKRTWMVAVLAAAVLVTGCSDDGGGEAGAGDPSPSAPTSAEPTEPDEPDEATASTQQYASLIAQQGDFRDELDAMAECNWTGSGSLDRDPALITCSLGLLGLHWTSSTLHKELLLASTPPKVDTGDYLGKPPAEIEKLLAQTITDAEALSAKAKEANDAGCAQTGEADCGKLRLEVRSAIVDLQSTLDGWAPYM